LLMILTDVLSNSDEFTLTIYKVIISNAVIKVFIERDVMP